MYLANNDSTTCDRIGRDKDRFRLDELEVLIERLLDFGSIRQVLQIKAMMRELEMSDDATWICQTSLWAPDNIQGAKRGPAETTALPHRSPRNGGSIRQPRSSLKRPTPDTGEDRVVSESEYTVAAAAPVSGPRNTSSGDDDEADKVVEVKRNNNNNNNKLLQLMSRILPPLQLPQSTHCATPSDPRKMWPPQAVKPTPLVSGKSLSFLRRSLTKDQESSSSSSEDETALTPRARPYRRT